MIFSYPSCQDKIPPYTLYFTYRDGLVTLPTLRRLREISRRGVPVHENFLDEKIFSKGSNCGGIVNNHGSRSGTKNEVGPRTNSLKSKN